MQKITPFLWLDNQAEEEAPFYASIFRNSKIANVVRYGEAGPGHKGIRTCIAGCARSVGIYPAVP